MLTDAQKRELASLRYTFTRDGYTYYLNEDMTYAIRVRDDSNPPAGNPCNIAPSALVSFFDDPDRCYLYTLSEIQPTPETLKGMKYFYFGKGQQTLNARLIRKVRKIMGATTRFYPGKGRLSPVYARNDQHLEAIIMPLRMEGIPQK